MTELLLEIFGWLGYIERPAVLLQLLLGLGLMLLCRLARQRGWLPTGISRYGYGALGLILLGLIASLLGALGQPRGLMLLLGLFWLGWIGMRLLRDLLAQRLPPALLHQLDSRLLRPLFLLVATLVLVSEVDSLHDVAVIRLGVLGGVAVSVGKLFNAALVLYLVLVACGPAAAGLAWLLQRILGMRDGSRTACELLLRYWLVAAGVVGVALHLGLNSTAVIAVAGGLSVGLGFGIKEVFSNFVSGLWLLFEGSVRPGEVLIIDGDACEVRHLGLRATRLWRDRDNAELLIPNQTFFTQAATTYTGTDRMRRSQVSVGAAYRHDPSEVIALLEATACSLPRVLAEPAPKALVIGYGDFAIQYALRFWIINPLNSTAICSEVNQAIWHAFREQGIEMPYPQQVQYQLPGPPL